MNAPEADDTRAVVRDHDGRIRPGGRLAFSDVVATGPIPVELRTQAAALAGCVSGAGPARTCGGPERRA